MKKKLCCILSLAIALATSMPSMAQPQGGNGNASLFKAESFEVVHNPGSLSVAFALPLSGIKPGSNRQVIFTPIVRSLDTPALSVELPQVAVAGRNRYYSLLRDGAIQAGQLLYRAGSKQTVTYAGAVDWQPWMSNSEVIIRQQTQDCCHPVKPMSEVVAARIGISQPEAFSCGQLGYVALTGDDAVVMEAQGTAYLDFKVNSTEILPSYRNNKEELRKMSQSIQAINNDPDATVTRLVIKGYASPEGSYDANARLAMGRTEALKEYVRRECRFDPKIMLANYEAEDWDGLSRWLKASDIPNRDAILAIAESDMAPDAKEAAIKSDYPVQYRFLLDNVFPSLRHSDYTVNYKIKTYAGIDELKRAYRDAPERLRPVDFFRVAQTFPEGSDEFDDVLLKAAEVYPADSQAAINAARILLRRGQLQAAADKASLAGESGEAYYTRALIALANGDIQRAEIMLRIAAEMGVTDALQLLGNLPRYTTAEKITCLIGSEN